MEELVERVAAWGRERADIRALAIVGSRARAELPADEWSDLDIVIVATDPQTLLDRPDWPNAIAPVWLTFLEPTAVGGEVERRVMFEGARDVDFVVLPASSVAEMAAIPEVAAVIRRGARILLDKDGVLDGALSSAGAAARAERPMPSEREFREALDDFLYHAIWAAKKLRRGETWVAAECTNCRLATLLVQMIGWHATVGSPGTDTWHRGRFLERWASPAVLRELRETFCRYHPTDVARAIEASVALFERLGRETAAAMSVAHPEDTHGAAIRWLRDCLAPFRTGEAKTG
jgi:aminoglycoside 6-adenylyltransferase